METSESSENPSAKSLATARRVVTAIDKRGKACVASDGRALASLEIAGPGSARFFNVWQTGPGTRLPFVLGSADPAATLTDMTRIFPGPGGTHLTISRWPPDFPAADSLPLWMHSTDTVDYIIIISGEISCFLDSGEKVVLSAGDCLVQNGTEHAWRNEGSEDCVMAAVAVSVSRDDERTAPSS